MRRPGWNPNKRNRNIGTTKQGHSRDNELTIPQPTDTLRSFYERFDGAQTSTFSLHGREIPVISENLKEGFYYSCTPADVEHILNHLPAEDLAEFGMVIFRQPKKKERILSPVWGRLIYSVEFKNDYYPAIILEALPDTGEYSFPKKQTPEDKKEFELLQADGLNFKLQKREYLAEINPEIARSIQLYRTLLHEVGHYVHYLATVERPGKEDEEYEEWEQRDSFYFNIAATEKENYANNYATRAKKMLIEKGIIPFAKKEAS